MEKDNVGALELMSTVLLETGRTEEALPVRFEFKPIVVD